jgi:hypothetical protein
MVTPFRFRAVTSSPSGKWRSIFLTGGIVSIFLRASLSSRDDGEVLSFLIAFVNNDHGQNERDSKPVQAWLGRSFQRLGVIQCR